MAREPTCAGDRAVLRELRSGCHRGDVPARGGADVPAFDRLRTIAQSATVRRACLGPFVHECGDGGTVRGPLGVTEQFWLTTVDQNDDQCLCRCSRSCPRSASPREALRYNRIRLNARMVLEALGLARGLGRRSRSARLRSGRGTSPSLLYAPFPLLLCWRPCASAQSNVSAGPCCCWLG